MDDFTNSQEFIVADLVTGAVERRENSRSGDVFSRPQHRRIVGLTRGEFLVRTLALAGGLVFVVAVCLPWVMVITTSSDPAHPIITQLADGTIQYDSRFPLDAFAPLWLVVRQHTPQRILDHLGFDTISILIHGAIPALGILVSTLLWRRLDTNRARLAVKIFSAWTIFGTIFTLFSIDRLLTRMWLFFPGYFGGFQGPNSVPHIWTGFWLALASLAMQWVAVVYLVREMRRTPISSDASSVRPARSWPHIGGALALTVGVPLWGVSFFLLYWATVGECSPLPFVQKFCNGRLDAVDGLSSLDTFIYTHINPTWDFTIKTLITTLFLLLALGGVAVIVSAWVQATSSMRTIWLALWAALSALLTVIAVQGMVSVVANQSPDIHFAPVADQYTLAPGLYLACLAVVANTLAILLIWQAERTVKPANPGRVTDDPVVWG